MNKIPDWLARLPDDAYLNAKDMVRLYGCSPNTSANTLMKHGSIPDPSHRFGKNGKYHWNVKYIKRWLREKV